jgi:hypothetical protein
MPEGVDPIDVADEHVSPASRWKIWSRARRCRRRCPRDGRVPEEQRMAILLKEYHGLTFQEIADS